MSTVAQQMRKSSKLGFEGKKMTLIDQKGMKPGACEEKYKDLNLGSDNGKESGKNQRLMKKESTSLGDTNVQGQEKEQLEGV